MGALSYKDISEFGAHLATSKAQAAMCSLGDFDMGKRVGDSPEGWCAPNANTPAPTSQRRSLNMASRNNARTPLAPFKPTV
jgi:hypothetical protein